MLQGGSGTLEVWLKCEPHPLTLQSQDKVEEMTGRGLDFKGGSKLLAVIGDEVLYKESCSV